MIKKDIRGALGASLKAEERSLADRFERADVALQPKQTPQPTVPAPALTPALTPQPHLAQLPTADALSVTQSPTQPVVRPSATRVIRDSFTIPKGEYQHITTLKSRCLGLGTSVTKSEVLRAGLAALQTLPDQELTRLFQTLEKVKTGRPQVE